MSKWWWLAAGGLVATTATVGGLVAMSWLREPEPEWTTRSPEALEAYERGLDELAKLYWLDAAAQFDRALELDPDFAAAKLQWLIIHAGSPAEIERRVRELEEVDVEELTPRERFLLTYWSARYGGEPEKAAERLTAYLKQHPEDPWAIVTSCDDSWDKEAWDRAEACYRRLIDLHPNWVQAQNRLGLIAMAQGRFEQAEEHFRTYGFIAPDQAAPWDALGQLLAVRGQYDESERAFKKALEIKDDYCRARWNLARLYSLRHQLKPAQALLEEIETASSCEEYRRWGMVCSRRGWLAYLRGDLEGAAQAIDEACLQRRGGFDFSFHRLALARGDLATAEALERALTKRLEMKREQGDLYLSYENFLMGTALHVSGMRQWTLGDVETACRELREGDERLLFWGIDRAVFKLFNLRQLAECLEQKGDPAGAAEARRRIEQVNPRYLADYKIPELNPQPEIAGASR